MLQCVAVRCSVCCSVLLCVRCSALQHIHVIETWYSMSTVAKLPGVPATGGHCNSIVVSVAAARKGAGIAANNVATATESSEGVEHWWNPQHVFVVNQYDECVCVCMCVHVCVCVCMEGCSSVFR